tara:strand:+ start:241 stop:405 length:165 start_codon:yes stop_codon:yes gene_type:complete
MAMTEYDVSIMWHIDSSYNWENRTDNFDASTENWSYQGSQAFRNGKLVPVWTEI